MNIQEICQKYAKFNYKVILVYEKKHDEFGSMIEYLPFAARSGAIEWILAIRQAQERGYRLDYTVGEFMIINTDAKFNP